MHLLRIEDNLQGTNKTFNNQGKMNCTATIKLTELSGEEKKHIMELFVPEDKELSNNRAKYKLNDASTQEISIVVEAKDGVALRAVLGSIGKTLAVYEKMKTIVSGEKE